MKKKNFETSELITFDTVYGDKQINIDIPRENFDLENCTVWLTSEQISDLCNATVAFVKANRIMTSGVLDDDKCVRYGMQDTMYNLSVSIMLMIEYAPTVANRFIAFVTKKLCELYLKEKTSKDITLKEFPYIVESMKTEYESIKKKTETLETSLKNMNDDFTSLKQSLKQTTPHQEYDVTKTLEAQNCMESSVTEKHTDIKDHVEDDVFFTVPEFMRLPSVNRLFFLKGISDNSRLFTMIKSVITTQVNHSVRDEMSRSLNIRFYEADSMFNAIMRSWKSNRPKPLNLLVPQDTEEKLNDILRYVKTYTFIRDNETKYNCLLSYPYRMLKNAVKTALKRNEFEEVFDAIKSVIASDEEIDSLVKQYLNT